MKIVVVTGTREGDLKLHGPLLEKAILSQKPSIVIVGGAKGIDLIAEKICKEKCIPVLTITADWTYYGDSAGHKRNGRMLDMANLLSSNVVVLAFPASDAESKGTRNCIEQAKKKGLEPIIQEIEVSAAKEVWEWKIQ